MGDCRGAVNEGKFVCGCWSIWPVVPGSVCGCQQQGRHGEELTGGDGEGLCRTRGCGEQKVVGDSVGNTAEVSSATGRAVGTWQGGSGAG